MGKYMRKSKATGEIALMEVSQSLGVRTRAKTLALQKLQKSPVTLPPATASGGSYLQLRSRRLEKPPVVVTSGYSKRQRQALEESSVPNPNPNPNPINVPNSRVSSRFRVNSVNSGSISLDCLSRDVANSEKQESEDVKENEIQENNVDDGEACFGENMLEFEGRERSTRENTPCSLIRDPDNIRTPGSSNRPTRLTEDNRQMQNPIGRQIPTAYEMNEFFAGIEEEQRRKFIEKYNFDPVKDEPLPGRYEWVKIDP